MPSMDSLQYSTRCSWRRQTSPLCRNLVNYNSDSFVPLCENMTSSTKPELHNVLHCSDQWTELRSQVTSFNDSWSCGFRDMRADRAAPAPARRGGMGPPPQGAYPWTPSASRIRCSLTAVPDCREALM